MKIRYWLILALAIVLFGLIGTSDFEVECHSINGHVMANGDCSK